ncbi:methyltransferase-like protein 17, mitochondrial [Liolophura sinensis]|uniref:methyltransferase-like protein 17, mitochondrial n=1 Tax=Liolophura sinensis TaxID=3198878 RepID=UPI00315805A7
MQLRKQVYHWKSIEYTAYKGFLYMVGKMDHDYAALLRCLNEIRSRIPEFTPRTVFDYGSGVGSVIWGVNSVWKRGVQEYYCVDRSGEMNTLARLLLQDGEDNKEMQVSGVHFRQFHPSTKHQFDLTVSAFSLFEFPNRSERLAAVKNLWDMTGEFMILVENGSIAGFKLIQEAREYILGLGDSNDGHVFAPCPHDSKCPKLSWTKSSVCNFEVTYQRLQLSSNTTISDKARFSYVILRKGRRQSEAATYMWPRLVKRSSKPRNHTPCTMCCPDGTIKSVVITASKHSKDLYKCSRYCHLGDLLPVKMSQQKEEGHTDRIHDNINNVDQSEGTESGEESDTDRDHSASGLYPQDSLSPS